MHACVCRAARIIVFLSLALVLDFLPILSGDAMELFDSDDGCSQRIYSSTGIPFGSETYQYVHVS